MKHKQGYKEYKYRHAHYGAVAVSGKPIILKGYGKTSFFVHKLKGWYSLVEVSTGCKLVKDSTIKGAIYKALALLYEQNYNNKSFKKFIESCKQLKELK